MIKEQHKSLAAEMAETIKFGGTPANDQPAQCASSASCQAAEPITPKPLRDWARAGDIVQEADINSIGELLNGPALLLCGRQMGNYISFDGFVSNKNGLYYQPPADDGGDLSPAVYVCDPIRIVAQSRDENRSHWGIVVAWTDDDGFEHITDIPLETLLSTGEQVRQQLLAGGLRADPSRSSRTHLVRYLASVRSQTKLTLVTRAGWHRDCYVAPGRVYASREHDLLFRSRTEGAAPFSHKGSLDDWKSSIGRYAIGNGLLMLSLGAAFASPLLNPLNIAGGGFHFRGPSSVGKSVLLKVSASVWSDYETFVKTWRATSNGLEGIATTRNDGLLLLDELGESDPKSALATVYMLSNGVGKGRATRSGEARPSARWRLLFLSSGEVSLSDLASSDRFSRNNESMAGQEVRFLDIQADTGKHGIYSELHDMPGGRELSEHLECMASKCHGAPIAAYLNAIVRLEEDDFEQISARITQRRLELLGNVTDGQVARAARRFALASIGAELASEFGIGPWSAQQAFQGIKSCYESWLSDRGGQGAVEDMQAVRRIRDYLSQNASRFQESNSKFAVDNRAGFVIRAEGRPPVFAFSPRTFRDALMGLNSVGAAKSLSKLGHLIGPDNQGKFAHSKSLGGEQHRVYLVRDNILNAE